MKNKISFCPDCMNSRARRTIDDILKNAPVDIAVGRRYPELLIGLAEQHDAGVIKQRKQYAVMLSAGPKYTGKARIKKTGEPEMPVMHADVFDHHFCIEYRHSESGYVGEYFFFLQP